MTDQQFLRRERKRRYYAQQTGVSVPDEFNLTKEAWLEKKYGIRRRAEPVYNGRESGFVRVVEMVEDDYERVEIIYPKPIVPDPPKWDGIETIGTERRKNFKLNQKP